VTAVAAPSGSDLAGPHIVEPVATESPMKLMTERTPTQFFNDSCDSAELRYAVERGATGATSNPVICLTVLRSEADRWMPRALEIVRAQRNTNERALAWQLYTEMGASAARLLVPVFEAHDRTWGRLSVQTDPTLHNDSDAMLAQAESLHALGPNMQVKMPATAAGIAMIEEATFRGVTLNVTVSFCVPQVLAIAEAIERGLRRRDEAGLDTSHMAPAATMMIGRLDDWMKVVAKRDGIDVDPAVMDWAGIACAKRALGLFHERGYRTKLLAAAFRHLGHWTELIGGELILTMPAEWQVKANRSGHDPVSRIGVPVDPAIVAELGAKIPDFVRAYEPNGMTVDEFDTFGPVVRTLRSFIGAWYDFVGVVRDVMLPDPDT
jgi:transaldolase